MNNFNSTRVLTRVWRDPDTQEEFETAAMVDFDFVDYIEVSPYFSGCCFIKFMDGSGHFVIDFSEAFQIYNDSKKYASALRIFQN